MKIQKLGILLGFLILTGVLRSQTDFRPGYIIRTEGDTIFGKIDYRGDRVMSVQCRFKDDNNTITRYTPNEISAYRFIDSKYYVAREVDGKFLFLEYLIKGELNVYYCRGKKEEFYFIDKDSLELSELPYKESTIEKDGRRYLYESQTHIGLLKHYTQDAPQFEQRIDEFRKPEHKDLLSLAEDYHYAVCEDEKCIIYEKNVPFFKVNLEAVAGVVKFGNLSEFSPNLSELDNRSFLQSGLIAHIWLPRANEKIFLKTGVMFSHIGGITDQKEEHVRLLAHIGYMAPETYRIRPSFSVGFILPSYSLGVNFKILDNLNLGIQTLSNFEPVEGFFLIPDKAISHSLLGSLYIEF